MRHSVLAGIAAIASCGVVGVAWQSTRGASYGRWVPAGTMNAPRHDHYLLRLADGRVMAIGGGHACGKQLRTGDVWDPSTNAWTLTGSTAAPHDSGFSATLLEDGRVLLAGGSIGGERTSDVAELWDPETNQWTKTASLAQRRMTHFSVLLADGRVLVAGGWAAGYRLASTEIWDPATQRWSRSGDLSRPRNGSSAVRLADGRVAIAGGFVDGEPATAPEIWDPATGRWTALAAPVSKIGTKAARTLDGRFVLVSWAPRSFRRPPAEAVRFDPANGAVEKLPAIEKSRDRSSIANLLGGELLISGGGYDEREEPGFLEKMEAGGEDIPAVVVERYLDDTEILDPEAGRWHTAPPLAEARSRHGTALLPDGGALISGGTGERGALRSAERWVPARGR